MKASELRIGNLINYRDEGLNPNITPIFLGRDLMLQILDGRCNVDYTIEPIPLTEEWLVRFGFESINDSCGYRININKNKSKFWLTVFLSHDTNGEEVWGCNHADLTQLETHECFCSSIPVDIDYVHQLQNLYFALTGTELSYNPNPNNPA